MSAHAIEQTVYPVLRDVQANPKTKRVTKYLRDYIGETRRQIVEAAINDTPLHDLAVRLGRSEERTAKLVQTLASDLQQLNEKDPVSALAKNYLTTGKKKALRELLTAVEPSIAKVCQSYGIAGSMRDDVMMETQSRIVDGLPGFKFESTVSTWVNTITRNVIVTQVREQQKQRSREVSYDATISDDSENTLASVSGWLAYEDAYDIVESAEIKQALANLSEDHKEILTLKMSGLSNPEIADELGIAAGTVKSRVSRARRQLSRALEQADEPAKTVSSGVLDRVQIPTHATNEIARPRAPGQQPATPQPNVLASENEHELGD